MVIRRYSSDHSDEWNSFISRSKNGTFLFDRRFMDYHSDRYPDHSLMFYDDRQRLVGLLPATALESTFHSHCGLTYGGMVVDERFTVSMAVEAIRELNVFLKDEGYNTVVYKALPFIYSSQPSEEVLYAIFHECKFMLVGRDVATVINLKAPLPWMKLRKRGATKALKSGLSIRRSTDYEVFWHILDNNLMSRYGVHPVHSFPEISLLARRFPDNIVLYEATDGREVLGGIVLFVTRHVVHTQYISASPEGKARGAIDLLFERAITDFSQSHDYFDFGKSTERQGHFLNSSLIFQKEGFGGRAVCYDTYQWTL